MKKPSRKILNHAKNVLKNMENYDAQQSRKNYENFCKLTKGMNNAQLLEFFAELSFALEYCAGVMVVPYDQIPNKSLCDFSG